MERRVHVDVKDSELKGLKLGEKVRIVMEGKVVEMRSGDAYEMISCCGDHAPEKNETPASVYVKVTKQTFKSGGSQIDELLDDEEDSE